MPNYPFFIFIIIGLSRVSGAGLNPTRKLTAAPEPPTMIPTVSFRPTRLPTETPSFIPTLVPTLDPTPVPTEELTMVPSKPTLFPTELQTSCPTKNSGYGSFTTVPSLRPTYISSSFLSEIPSFVPTKSPTLKTSLKPTTEISVNGDESVNSSSGSNISYLYYLPLIIISIGILIWALKYSSYTSEKISPLKKFTTTSNIRVRRVNALKSIRVEPLERQSTARLTQIHPDDMIYIV